MSSAREEIRAAMDAARPNRKPLLKRAAFWRDNPGVINGVSTGYDSLDYPIAGLERATETIVAARPGVGKSQIAINIADNVAEQIIRERAAPGWDGDLGPSVAYFTLEMSKEQTEIRWVGKRAAVSPLALKRGTYRYMGQEYQTETAHYNAFARAAIEFEKLPVFIYGGNLTSTYIRDTVEEMHEAGYPPRLVIIDYLGLCADTDGGESLNARMTHISRRVKLITTEFDLPVLALHQLNRAVEGRETKVPMLSDLRDSGSLEQDANNVLFAVRPEMYLTEGGAPAANVRDLLEVYVSKARDGESGHKVKLRFQKSTGIISEWE